VIFISGNPDLGHPVFDDGTPGSWTTRRGKLEALAERAFTLEGSQARFDLDEIAKLVD
jgi:hypothetical protein